MNDTLYRLRESSRLAPEEWRQPSVYFTIGSMRILQLGGVDFLTLPLAVELELHGHRVSAEVLGVEDWREFEVVHVHWLEGFEQQDLAQQVRGMRRSSEQRFFLTVYPSSEPNHEAIPAPNIELFSHVFVAGPDCISHKSATSFSWHSPGLSFDTIQPPQCNDPARNKLLNVLELESARLPSDSLDLSGRVTRTLLKKTDERDVAAVTNALRACDLLIETLTSKSYGVAGLLALAMGKTVLSGNAPEAQQAWEQLKMSPVLHATKDNINSRVESILREPRCLRDFAKRSRQYVEKFHRIQSSAQIVAAAYRRFGAGDRTGR